SGKRQTWRCVPKKLGLVLRSVTAPIYAIKFQHHLLAAAHTKNIFGGEVDCCGLRETAYRKKRGRCFAKSFTQSCGTIPSSIGLRGFSLLPRNKNWRST